MIVIYTIVQVYSEPHSNRLLLVQQNVKKYGCVCVCCC